MTATAWNNQFTFCCCSQRLAGLVHACVGCMAVHIFSAGSTFHDSSSRILHRYTAIRANLARFFEAACIDGGCDEFWHGECLSRKPQPLQRLGRCRKLHRVHASLNEVHVHVPGWILLLAQFMPTPPRVRCFALQKVAAVRKNFS